MKPLSELFNIRYGNGLQLNRMTLTTADCGIPFVSRKRKNNGIAAYVEAVVGERINPAGELTCALNGEGGVMATFLQERPYYTAFHIACLSPKTEMTRGQKLYYSECLWRNHYRYSWGRMANRTIKSITVPDLCEIPEWAETIAANPFSGTDMPACNASVPELNQDTWVTFEYQSLFDIEVGSGPRLKDLDGTGSTPVITSSDSNNGLTGFASARPNHNGNTLSVNRNGSVAEAFYQRNPFCSSEDVHVFLPKFTLNPFIALFMTTLIRREKFRFTYGRKWSIDRMKRSLIRLPVAKDGSPDWDFMERYIKSLPYSSQL